MNKSKQLPYIQHTSAERQKEDVRPIFWANNPQSYAKRTQEWDEFPNGRWGPSRSPAFADDNKQDEGFVSYTKKFKTVNFDEKKKQWGAQCKSYDEVAKVFCDYISGSIKKFPFSEGSLAEETSTISESLLQLNASKLLTINSQPKVNGAKSTDPAFGWGPEKGYVYQKAYFEFFVHQSLIEKLAEHLAQFEDLSWQAVNVQGQQLKNVGDNDVNAVTWGIFNGKEIVQPTVVDSQAFLIWKDEAFRAWTDTWGKIYSGKKNKDSGELEGVDQDSIDFLHICQ